MVVSCVIRGLGIKSELFGLSPRELAIRGLLSMKKYVKRLMNGLGKVRQAFDYRRRPEYQILSAAERSIVDSVKHNTMISVAGIVACIDSAAHLAKSNLAGAIVECGVWRGGAVQAMLLKLVGVGDMSRDVFLFDTFQGMTEPTAEDVSYEGSDAVTLNDGTHEGWCLATLEEVRATIASTGYPQEKVHFVQGDVRDTIPQWRERIGPISLLRLDTDWYELTKLEMNALYPLLVSRGLLIVDDYGFWKGARQAIDEYFQQQSQQPFLFRIDYSERLLIKP